MSRSEAAERLKKRSITITRTNRSQPKSKPGENGKVMGGRRGRGAQPTSKSTTDEKKYVGRGIGRDSQNNEKQTNTFKKKSTNGFRSSERSKDQRDGVSKPRFIRKK